MTYITYIIAFFERNYIYIFICFLHRLLSVYFAFVEDDHNSTLAAAISLL